ncbi:hypothetical protein [Lacticaseibacillus saniviri]|uniref:Uncharacterized protein n=1 Tax=Lacticaseibacillus saniviri JCM 17471 = DSM 24301 TaxID=1293598 RepID=A0A0R2MU39_9LACO|nr:hypothetical protein [Lacticaseibacillus saniviri]KRO16364.1 hypothetical protein IV56_GL001145 [Lacticaseibacillus saniviri JCM 17471 = DSM 24301]MCG4282232.1 hypothetical protein [Lacticaseibacillus saniviri]
MYELTKKRRVSDAVAEVFPEEVSKAIFDVINVMNKAGQIVTSPVAIAFSDDSTDDEIYAMVIQGQLAPAQEFPITYSGPKDFLGHGYILIVKDNAKTVRLDFSAANNLDGIGEEK